MNVEQEKYVLTIDCGTQSLRILIFDAFGNLLTKEKEDYVPYLSHGPGVAEKDPELYWQSAKTCIQRAIQQHPIVMSKVVAITVTTMRDTGVFLDQKMQVVRPSLIWLDQREAKCEKKMSKHYRLAFRIVGMTSAILQSRKQCKVNWVRENEPEVWEKTHYYLMLSGFFHYRLTGLIVDSIGNQIGHIPFDYKRQEWKKNPKAYQWEMFEIEKFKLPRLVKQGEIIGTLSHEVAHLLGLRQGIKVVAGASDKGCETLGVGCLSEDSVSISFGTTATIQTMSKRYLEPIKFMPSYPAVMVNHFNPEIQVFRGYWMIRWFKTEFASREIEEAKVKGVLPEVLLDQRLSEIPAGSDGLILQPLWKPDLKNPEGKGSIIGFSDIHTRSHIYRAIIEGINYSLIEGLKQIEKVTKKKVSLIFVSGGGSQSDAICQITADMFGLPVTRGETYEASGLGAAINAFVGLGIYPTYEEACKHMIRKSETFSPNAKEHHTYLQLYEHVYRKIYPRLRSLYLIMDRLAKK